MKRAAVGLAGLVVASAAAFTGAPDSSAAVSTVPTTFYCYPAVTAGTVCEPYPPAWKTSGPRKISITVTDHAALGERCRLYVDGIGLLSWVYIDPGDDSKFYLGTVEGNTGFNLRCQRRAASGDKDVGGRVWQDRA
ncbi:MULTISPECIES: hypothetical protein [Streptomyces]|uniref:Secreted protein n=1 Tax=Streptomyces cremeus TaxID=66881 RepID=A0ABV5PE83_STRCM